MADAQTPTALTIVFPSPDSCKLLRFSSTLEPEQLAIARSIVDSLSRLCTDGSLAKYVTSPIVPPEPLPLFPR